MMMNEELDHIIGMLNNNNENKMSHSGSKHQIDNSSFVSNNPSRPLSTICKTYYFIFKKWTRNLLEILINQSREKFQEFRPMEN